MADTGPKSRGDAIAITGVHAHIITNSRGERISDDTVWHRHPDTDGLLAIEWGISHEHPGPGSNHPAPDDSTAPHPDPAHPNNLSSPSGLR